MLIGGDSLRQLHLWYRAHDLVRNYGLIVYPRPDETVTVISTGSGLKDVNNALRAAGEPFLCEPDIKVLEASGRIR